MQTLTREAVRNVTRALITLEGETTSLDVKNALRKKGFWATQDQVREFMLDMLSKDGDVQYNDNGRYRVYTFKPENASVLSEDEIEDVLPPAVLDSLTSVQVMYHRDDVPATYLVTDASGNCRALYRNVSRSQAKASWARDMMKDFADARTQKQ